MSKRNVPVAIHNDVHHEFLAHPRMELPMWKFYTMSLMLFLIGATVALISTVLLVKHFPREDSVDRYASPPACNPHFNSNCY